MTDIPDELRGWWRIVETSQWMDDGLDDLGPALISFTGRDDRLRMQCLIADIRARPTATGVAFTWTGAWEWDPMSGDGDARIGEGGRLTGTLSIRDGDHSTFTAVRADQPDEPIPDPPSYRDKWRGRR